MDFSAIILAAGKGTRTGLEYNKVFTKIHGKKVLDYSIDFFEEFADCKEIVLVCSASDFNYIYDQYRGRVKRIIIGGETRQESVYKGLNVATYEYVLVHDSARPHINPAKIKNLVENVELTKASTLAVFATDTVVISNGNRLGKRLDRNSVLMLQTPQAFDRLLILEAHEKAIDVGYTATDDTDLITRFTEVVPSYIEGDYRSIKLTTKEDIEFLKVIL